MYTPSEQDVMNDVIISTKDYLSVQRTRKILESIIDDYEDSDTYQEIYELEEELLKELELDLEKLEQKTFE